MLLIQLLIMFLMKRSLKMDSFLMIILIAHSEEESIWMGVSNLGGSKVLVNIYTAMEKTRNKIRKGILNLEFIKWMNMMWLVMTNKIWCLKMWYLTASLWTQKKNLYNSLPLSYQTIKIVLSNLEKTLSNHIKMISNNS